ncbi:DMT family transporter [Halalkalibacter urbisdiaboli]|uniref:DMT family transporter n=1 Tax=Halalkalibacter urbisdiaboli TaxID=1960589 RepID=UPI000B43A408|nr:multidrug resistance efflux transporter family protein [Halalkalibacter urbisdiaboli]
MKAILIGIIASMFFSFTFILNRSMELEGGSWYWSSSLRFIFMVPLLFFIVWMRRGVFTLYIHMKENPRYWVKWSFVGFVLFYAPITFVASFGPGWLVAGTWQITIVAGLLLTPFFFEYLKTDSGTIKQRQTIPLRSLWPSLIILSGVAVIQFQQSDNISLMMIIISVVPIIIAAFAYPLGNRKMLVMYGGKIDTFQRVLGMTLASLPFWFVIAAFGLVFSGIPSPTQVLQSFLVALFSGVIATVLFFWATDMVRESPQKLAAVEATQSGAVMFALLGELVLLSGSLPSSWSIFGLVCIVIGMVIHSFLSRKKRSSSSIALKQNRFINKSS